MELMHQVHIPLGTAMVLRNSKTPTGWGFPVVTAKINLPPLVYGRAVGISCVPKILDLPTPSIQLELAVSP